MSISFWQELLIFGLVVLVSLYWYLRSGRSKNQAVLPTSWPLIGMLPSLVANLPNIHDPLSVVLARAGHNFRAHGPLGAGWRFFLTCDPANVRYIFTTNFPNYIKGAEFSAIFDILGGAMVTADREPWRRQRTKVQSILGSPRLVAHMATCCRDKVEDGLLPLLNHMESTGTPFDMQELMARFMSDLTAMGVIGVDPGLLSADMPPMDVSAAMDTVMEVGLVRHLMPAYCWKVMRWLNIGPERKLAAAHHVLRGFFSEMMERRKMVEGGRVGNDEEQEFILSSYITDPDFADHDLLCATFLGFMLAGRDSMAATLIWFFYILAQNPESVSIIRDELSPIALGKVAAGTAGAMVIFEPDETKTLTYLRAAMYESLRLYPPVPIEVKRVVANDIMPSGHEVHAGDTIFISMHSMGRMEGLWGKDCLDYKPERWFSEEGNKLRYIPSNKFLAFNSGPRICPGKEISVMQMKTIVATVLWNFDIEVVDGQNIQPKMSCLLQMKNGLMVKLKKREV